MDRRVIKRTSVDGVAWLLPAGASRLCTCRLVDLTSQGARIELCDVSAGALHALFDFSFDKFKTIRRARLVWSEGFAAGIEFKI